MPTVSLLSNNVIAKEALMLLENELVLSNLVHRGYEEEFSRNNNGYKPGSTITIRKPAKYPLRVGATMTVQDTVEGNPTLVVDKQIGVDLGGWTSQDRTLKIEDFSKRFLKPAMATVAQGVDSYVADLYKSVWNWVGTPGTALTNYAGFAKAPQRLDEMGVPSSERNAVLNPGDYWGMIGNTAGLYVQESAKGALQRAKLPTLGNVDTYMSQNAPSHTVGSRAGSGAVNGGSQVTTFTGNAVSANTQTLVTDGWTASGNFKAGDVITITGVLAVNPAPVAVGQGKKPYGYQQQFVVTADAAIDGSGNATLTISPAIITSGANQTCHITGGALADNTTIQLVGTANATHAQNLVFHKNAFALAMVPMVSPEGAVDVQRATHNGLSVRMIPIYNGSDDTSSWRLDVLFGVKAIYPDLAARLSGT